ncbi:hypothetical protein SDC9_99032 [bioreactor metagenome]|uniref:Uncharacterized protein n=1 Tax=bioreactor metagenome TaxID=1076179 RepID=A0A645AN39_9ZZZZ
MLDNLRLGKDLVVIHVRHANDQFITVGPKLFHSLPGCTHLRKARRIAEVKRRIFVENLLIHPSVIFKDKHIVL